MCSTCSTTRFRDWKAKWIALSSRICLWNAVSPISGVMAIRSPISSYPFKRPSWRWVGLAKSARKSAYWRRALVLTFLSSFLSYLPKTSHSIQSDRFQSSGPQSLESALETLGSYSHQLSRLTTDPSHLSSSLPPIFEEEDTPLSLDFEDNGEAMNSLSVILALELAFSQCQSISYSLCLLLLWQLK